MTDLTADAWISSNSEIQAEKLHAIGVVSFQWNQCELWLFYLLCGIAELPEEKVWTLVYDLGDVAICTRLKTLLATRGLHSDASALIENALDIYDLCRQNRNSIVHAWTEGRGQRAQLARKSKKPDQMEPTPFPSTLEDIRRVAEEIQWLSRRLWVLTCYLEDGRMVLAMPSPKKLPLPELLWKPPPQDYTAQKRQPRSSAASRRSEAMARKKPK
jgi:hypothetical protein